MKHYGDICKISGYEVPTVNVVIGGSPCFAAGTLITTDRGLVPIEDVKIGDSVFTHKRRFMPVTDSGCTGRKTTYTLKCVGCDPLIVTSNHPIYVRKRGKNVSEPAFVPVSDLSVDYCVGSPVVDIEENQLEIIEDGYIWYPIIQIEPNEEVDVYNLSVQEDESYCANNIAVHNCQDLSVAGKRAGLAGERSGLFMEQIRIIKEMREKDAKSGRTRVDIRPRFMVWENVCFTGDTLISTVNGFKRIDEIKEGDLVLTHSGRYMPVCATYVTESQKCISLKVQGSTPIICTGNHPFLAVKIQKGHNGCIIGYTEPEYIRADELTKDHMLLTRNDREYESDDFISDADAWAVGRWVADGSVDLKKSNPRIFISCGDYKLEYAEKMLSHIGENIHKNKPHKTATNFVFTSKRFYNLIATCGIGAANKRFPIYTFKLPVCKQEIMLDGYLSGDGYKRSRRNDSEEIYASTVSRELAYGIARLIRNVYGVPASIYTIKSKAGNIEGRKIYPRHTTYAVSATVSEKCRKNKCGDNYIMHRVKSVDPVPERHDVYNLSVMEDNTYVANGFVVHNCGAFSVNEGRDFAAVLEETIKVAEPEIPDIHVPRDGWTLSGAYVGRGWSVAWRVLDAQFWGVPQRRRRIALVADFGGQSAPEILFKSNSLQRYIKQGKETWQGTSGYVTDCIGDAGRCLNGWDVQSKHIQPENGIAECLWSGESRYGGGESYVLQHTDDSSESTVCYGISAYDSNAMKSGNPHSGVYETDTARTLDLNGGNPACNQGGIAVVETSTGFCPRMGAKAEGIGYADEQAPTLRANGDAGVVYPDVARSLTARNDGSPCIDRGPDVICVEMTSTKNTVSDDGISPTLTARMGTGGNQVNAVVTRGATYSCDVFHCDGYKEMAVTLKARDFKDPQCVAFSEYGAVDCRNFTENPEINGTLQAKENGGTSLNFNNVVRQHYIVRRLTPLECTRLQGFPDKWLDIGDWYDDNGKLHKESDSVKYKALGNSIAIPPWLFVLGNLNEYCEDKTMASLFSGIDGFPLIWSYLNGKESCVWSSEIEPFCRAVSRVRFPDDEET